MASCYGCAAESGEIACASNYFKVEHMCISSDVLLKTDPRVALFATWLASWLRGGVVAW